MTMATDETLESLRAENARLKAQQGIQGLGTLSREDRFRKIEQELLLDTHTIQAIQKFGHEDSSLRLTLQIDGTSRHLDCLVRKFPQWSYVRGLLADAADRVLDFRQMQWTPIANLILSAAEKVAGYERDKETIEWLAEFVQRACLGFRPAHLRRPANTYDLLVATSGRQAGALEASHRGEVFLILREDAGMIFSQADFIAFVWIQQTFRLGRGDTEQRLKAIGFKKEPVYARKANQVVKLKACWHSPPQWLQKHDVDLPTPPESRKKIGHED